MYRRVLLLDLQHGVTSFLGPPLMFCSNLVKVEEGVVGTNMEREYAVSRDEENEESCADVSSHRSMIQ
jgi:hypothetical protein